MIIPETPYREKRSRTISEHLFNVKMSRLMWYVFHFCWCLLRYKNWTDFWLTINVQLSIMVAVTASSLYLAFQEIVVPWLVAHQVFDVSFNQYGIWSTIILKGITWCLFHYCYRVDSRTVSWEPEVEVRKVVSRSGFGWMIEKMLHCWTMPLWELWTLSLPFCIHQSSGGF